MGRIRILAMLTSVIGLALPMSIVGSLAQSAATVNCGTFVNTQVGFSTNNWHGAPQPSTYEGVSANLTDRFGYVLCDSDTRGGFNFVTTRDMVFSNDGTGYAQSGTMYRYGYNGCVKRWAEQSFSGVFNDYYIGGCSGQNETHDYWQQMVFSNGSYVVRSNIDSTIIHQSTQNPFAYWTRPLQVGLDAESYYAINSIPGRNASREDYDGIQVQLFSNDGFVGSCGNIYLGQFDQNPTKWNVTAPSCSHTQTWDN